MGLSFGRFSKTMRNIFTGVAVAGVVSLLSLLWRSVREFLTAAWHNVLSQPVYVWRWHFWLLYLALVAALCICTGLLWILSGVQRLYYRDNLCWRTGETIPYCPVCWEAKRKAHHMEKRSPHPQLRSATDMAQGIYPVAWTPVSGKPYVWKCPICSHVVRGNE